MIISTLKENALDLALSDQVEHLQTYNSHLLDELQKEKERCGFVARGADCLQIQEATSKRPPLIYSKSKPKYQNL